MTKDVRDTATAAAHAEGKMTDSGKMRYVGAKFYKTNSNNKPAFLNRIAGVPDFEVKTSGTYEHRL